MLTDFQNFVTQGLSRDRLMNLKASIPYRVKCKCQETADNLKQMSRLTINFNLIYLTFFNLPRPAATTATA